MSCILELKELSFAYDSSQQVLENLNYTFDTGRIYTIVGRSGAGKTTLLSLLSGLAKPTGGQILVNGSDISAMDKYAYRSRQVGVVFQSFNLLPQLTAVENVELSMEISGVKGKNKRRQAFHLLERVGIGEEKARRRILKLSGGEQQRVAIARALSYDPRILLADEPTGNLDRETREEIMRIFRGLAEEGKCVILVTHSPTVSAGADVVYELSSKK